MQANHENVMHMFDFNESPSSLIYRMNEAFASKKLIKPKGSTENIIPGTFHLNKYNEVVVKLPDGRFATTQDIQNNIVNIQFTTKMKDQAGSNIYWTVSDDSKTSLQCPLNIEEAVFAHGYIDNRLYDKTNYTEAFKFVTYDNNKNRIWKVRQWTPGVPEYDLKRTLAENLGITKKHSCCYCDTTDVSMFSAMNLINNTPKLQTACKTCNQRGKVKQTKTTKEKIASPVPYGDPLLRSSEDAIKEIESHETSKLKRMNCALDKRFPGNCYLNKYNIPSILCSDGRLLTIDCIKNNALKLKTVAVKQQGSHYVYWALNHDKTETVEMPSDIKNAVIDHVYKQNDRFYFCNILGEKKEKRVSSGVPEYDDKMNNLRTTSSGHCCYVCGETDVSKFSASSNGIIPVLHAYCNACLRGYCTEISKHRSNDDVALHIARNSIKSNEKRRAIMKHGKLRAETIVHMPNEWLEWFCQMILEELTVFVNNGNIREFASIDRIDEDRAYAWEHVHDNGTVEYIKNFRIILKLEQTMNGIGFTEDKKQICTEHATKYSTNDYPSPSRELIIAVNEVRQSRTIKNFSSYSTELSRNIAWFVKESFKHMKTNSASRNKRKFIEYNEKVDDTIPNTILDMILEQGGVCSVSRIPFNFSKESIIDWKPSVDRTDSTTGGGYVASNINLRCLEFQPEFRMPSYIDDDTIVISTRWSRDMFLKLYPN